MNLFISCDWGTSSFRLRLVNAATTEVLAEVRNGQGIAATHELWKQDGDKDRVAFYCRILAGQVKLLEQLYKRSLYGITIVISGMASSSIGIIELPYATVPCSIGQSNFAVYNIPASPGCSHKIALVPGLRSQYDDVMRGEETILLGCDMSETAIPGLFILPGTHSKHIVIEDEQIAAFKTFMTGELFSLLSNHSVLTVSLEETEVLPGEIFIKGVKDAANGSLLNNIFHVRTNSLFSRFNKKENYYYLSGLLIGEELKALQHTSSKFVTVVSSGVLLPLYAQALSALGIQEVRQQDADIALIKGQAIIFHSQLS